MCVVVCTLRSGIEYSVNAAILEWPWVMKPVVHRNRIRPVQFGRIGVVSRNRNRCDDWFEFCIRRVRFNGTDAVSHPFTKWSFVDSEFIGDRATKTLAEWNIGCVGGKAERSLRDRDILGIAWWSWADKWSGQTRQEADCGDRSESLAPWKSPSSVSGQSGQIAPPTQIEPSSQKSNDGNRQHW